MSDIAIRVEKMGKRYSIGRRIGYQTFRESVTDTLLAPIRLLRRTRRDERRAEDEHIWAVKDVSFEIPRGEVVGVDRPQRRGQIDPAETPVPHHRAHRRLRRDPRPRGLAAGGGTGFHPELTGRENIYLNGAILGMTQAEIARKFDEIVAFAEVEKFIDTPVKHYSSGMYMRLAFAVAAHLEPEILIVDEVLAVGDAAFQKKCLGKMQDVGRAGRTVIFVSHSMPAIARLCPKTLLLDAGKVVRFGATHDVVSNYLRSDSGSCAARQWVDSPRQPGSEVVTLRSVRIRGLAGETRETVDVRDPVGIEMEYEVRKPGYALVPNFNVHDDQGVCLFTVHDLDPAWRRRPKTPGIYSTTAWVPGDLLAEGTHFVGAGVSTMIPLYTHFYESDAVAFHVVDGCQGDSARGDFNGDMPGIVRPLLEWSTRLIGENAEGAAESAPGGDLALLRGV